ncbi:MAG: hypothetical protein E7226_04610 [Clostridiales bacterium]|nr:hypothetical protein [Clostridiales bacterium]
MKKANETGNKLFRLLTVFFISALICFGVCACGDSANTEETVEITTPSEETTAPADDETQTDDASKDEDSSEDGEGKSEDTDKTSGSQYEKIYKDCNAEMKKATDKYVDELKDLSSSLSKNKLYDETQNRIDELKKIYDDGKDKMVKAMLASTEDDDKDYKKNFQKLTEAYTEYTRDITSAYTDAF